MSLSPALGPCSPDPICRPSPVPRMPQKSGWRLLTDTLQRHVGEPYRVWRQRERLYAEMCRLDHRELKDLGITEGAIGDIVAQWHPKH